MRREMKTPANGIRWSISELVPLQGRPPTFSPGLLEMRVLARVNGTWTVGDIARDLELSPTEVMAVLERLERIGAIRWLGVIALGSEALEEVSDSDRPTMPDPTHERPTWPSS
jgi:hypothetical protein